MSLINAVMRVAEVHAATIQRIGRSAANLGVVLLWIWLYWPIFGYLGIIFSREDFRTNQILLLGVVALIVMRLRNQDVRLHLDALPAPRTLPLILIVGASIGFLGVERYLDINTVSASLFGLATYGLLGLWIAPIPWRQGLPAILLLIGTLPFGDHLQTFVGYPMRIATAAMVQDGLRAVGVQSVGIDTILVLENGVSQIDLPCSGVKSLWTGMLFLIAATWIERRPINLKWFGIAALMGFLLFCANLARVAVLVVVGQVAGWRLAAEMLHVPLGVLGFAAVCTVVVGLLQLQRPFEDTSASSEKGSIDVVVDGSDVDPLPQDRRYVAWLHPALMIFLLVMIFLYVPRPEDGLSAPLPAWDFPAALITERQPLTDAELAAMRREGADLADRHRFEWNGVSGSMIFVTSNTWRAHHRPERCFEVRGLSIDDSQPHLVALDFPLRAVSLGDGARHNLYAAAYWYQSADRVTDDFATRIWADLSPVRQRWVLVSVLFDDVDDPRAPELAPFYEILRQTVDRTLGAE